MIDKTLLVRLLKQKRAQGDFDFEDAIESIEEFPENDGKTNVDRIQLGMALESPVWMMIAASEPHRPIDVRMTYADLMCIHRRFSYEERKEGDS